MPTRGAVTPGLDPGAQAATVVSDHTRRGLDARVEPAHDGGEAALYRPMSPAVQVGR